MEYNKKEPTATEHFDFGSPGDLNVSRKGIRRNVRNEVNNKDFDPQAVIDAFEIAKGIKRRPASDGTEGYVFKNIILDPETQKDQDMLNELLNNKRYLISLWKDTWTMQGSFRIFIVYGAKPEDPDKEEPIE